MFWLDWIIVFIPLLIVLYVGMKSQRYVKGVADFLTAGRVAGRYVVAVASGEAAMGLISIVAMIERDYSSGFGFAFWNRVGIPLTLLFSLTGYCAYRFRETKAMTMGQFLELRYNRPFRIFAAILQSISGILNYAIFPAVGARFLIYFLDFPAILHFGAVTIPTTAVVMAAFLGLALLIALVGGQVTVMVTDCVQGLLAYPMYLILIGYILYRFNWWTEMAPALENRVSGESFLNPYNIENLRDFNVFYVVAGVFAQIFNRMAWAGGSSGYNAAAVSPHEQKMGGVLGTWRSGFSVMMYTLLAVSAFTYLNHPDFAGKARDVRLQLANKTIEDVAAAPEYDQARLAIRADFKNIPTQYRRAGIDAPISQKDTLDKPYQTVVEQHLRDIPGGRGTTQTFRTIYGQMLVPLALREMLPMGVTGIFCAIMIFLLTSTDTAYMHSWGSIIAQDIVLPLRGKPFTPRKHLLLLRCCIVFVCLFAYIFSLFFAQLDYILMFFQITGAIWMGGAGSCIVFGLYSRRGTSAGAFASLISGCSIAAGGFILQNTWANHVYPYLERASMVESVGNFLSAVSEPFNPFIVWTMNPTKFPINSQELLFLSMVTSIIMYLLVSWLTCRKPFNLERMLHRGVYNTDKTVQAEQIPWTIGGIGRRLLGITSQYTTGDKIIAWSAFIYSFVYGFLVIFIAVVVWNAISPWPDRWWSQYFFITSIIVTGIVGLVTSIWFAIGGTRDLIDLFRRLSVRQDNALDDGRVVGNISVDDLAMVEKIEKSEVKSE